MRAFRSMFALTQPAATRHASATRAPLAMLLVAGLLGGLLALTPSGAPAQAAASATISGSVSGDGDGDGTPTPLADAYVVVVDHSGEQVRHIQTAPDGRFEMAGLAAGSYTLVSFDGAQDFATQWWKNKLLESTATYFDLAAGATKTGFDITLARGSSISGTVVAGSPATPLSGVTIIAVNPSGEGSAVVTDANGNYTIRGLSTLPHKVKFWPYDTPYAIEWWTNQATEGTANTVTVAAGGTASGINAELELSASLSGTLSYSHGGLLADVLVTAFDTAGVEAGSTSPNGDGRYTLPDLHSGTYTLQFTGNSDAGPLVEWWQDQPTRNTAKTITVTAGQHLAGLDADLAPKALTTTPAPTVTGTPKVGATLTANAAWVPAPDTLSYQWARAGTRISGATGRTYKPVMADAGAKLTVTVTGSKVGYVPAAKTSVATALVTGGVLTATPTPTISGTVRVGQTLTAKSGTWLPAPVTLKYQWSRAGKAITGATASSYKLVAADAGKTLTVKVSGAKSGFTTVGKTSAATAVVTNVLTATPTPKIAGTVKVGQKLTAKPGTWAPATVTLKYQWLRAGKVISGATASTYKLVTADAGKTLTLKVTGSKTGFVSVAKTSAATVKVAK